MTDVCLHGFECSPIVFSRITINVTRPGWAPNRDWVLTVSAVVPKIEGEGEVEIEISHYIQGWDGMTPAEQNAVIKARLVDLLTPEVEERLHRDGVRCFDPHPPGGKAP
jgi:hypothetical protein